MRMNYFSCRYKNIIAEWSKAPDSGSYLPEYEFLGLNLNLFNSLIKMKRSSM